MEKLIDADVCKAYLKRVIWGADPKIDNWVDSMPAVDAAPVVHGAWVPLDDDPPEDFECNVCGYVSTASFDCSGITPNAFPYCPMCGARMDGGEENDATD